MLAVMMLAVMMLAVMMLDVMMLDVVMLDVMMLAVMMLAGIGFRVSHTGLSYYMFAQPAWFSNFQRDTVAATPNVMMHCLDSLSHIIKYTEKKTTRQTHPF